MKSIFFATALVLLSVTASSAQLRSFEFNTLDSNAPEIERQSVITGASLTSDFDGEGLNNDLALIDQGRGIVFILLFSRQGSSPRSIAAINVRSMFDAQFVPTSATAFIDARTGLQDIAITAASAV